MEQQKEDRGCVHTWFMKCSAPFRRTLFHPGCLWYLPQMFSSTSVLRRLLFGILALTLPATQGSGATFYVRQTVGDDSKDGLSPQTAWRSISKLSPALLAGDTAYVGPGLYRDSIQVRNSGTIDKRITLIADTTGQHTGDPPGVVMITGAQPVDESIFVRIAPGVYRTRFEAFQVAAAVEMDSDQFRYTRTGETREHLVENMPEVDVVKKLRRHLFHDEATKELYIHTSDDKPPTAHELELVRQGNGISTSGQHFITIIGFTFRHLGDAGMTFWEGSGDVIAINNTAYGSRQGVRVYSATNVLLYGNTFFRNENSGAYFELNSFSSTAIGNISYENVKGLRWGTWSAPALAFDNKVFDNLEAGISIEKTIPTVLRGNRAVNNKKEQLVVIQSEYSSEENCFENGSPDQLTALFYPYTTKDKYSTLADYQKAIGQDLHSREGGCGPLPEKLDVHRLHAETMAYAERARKILAEAAARATPSATPSPTPAVKKETSPTPAVKKETGGLGGAFPGGLILAGIAAFSLLTFGIGDRFGRF
jgi:parallel beta-helix repeat protein